MPLPVDPSTTNDLEVLFETAKREHNFSADHYKRVDARIAEIQESNRSSQERIEKTRQERRSGNDFRHVKPHSKRGDKLDIRNVQYAGKSSFKATWQAISPVVLTAWGGYKFLESECLAPPIKTLIGTAEFIVVLALVGVFAFLYFVIRLLMEKFGDFKRK